jgi:O2-independent ubiquinone biosynthesis protein UbiV
VRLALGPLQYCWPRSRVLAFYEEAAGWPLDVVYLGEVVCAKRRELRLEDWMALGDRLAAARVEVVLSSLTLLESAGELGGLRRLARNGRFLVEANDMAAVGILAREGLPFVGGPTLNAYNARTLAVLARQGMARWVLPFELGARSAAALIAGAPPGCPCEVLAWGRLPLAWSARCYTARAENRPKDACGIACREDPDGRLLHTRDGQAFLVLNGVQVQSALTQSLAPQVVALAAAGVEVLRLSPQSENMAAVVRGFAALRGEAGGDLPARDLASLAPVGTCAGYWRGEAGFR